MARAMERLYMKFGLLLVVLLCGFMAGCSDEKTTATDRQNAALRDPFNYSSFDDPKSDAASGAKSKKDSMSHDLNSVFNP